MINFLCKFYLKEYKKIFIPIFTIAIIVSFTIVLLAKEEGTAKITDKSIDIILMLDKSKSVNLKSEDSVNTLQAAEFLIDFVETYQKIEDTKINIAYIPFGKTILREDFPLKYLDVNYKNQILKEIKTGKSIKTDFIPPFIKAMELFDFSKKNKKLIILFTDGVPDIREKIRSNYPSESEVLKYFNSSTFKTIINHLTEMDIIINVIGLNDMEFGNKWTHDSKSDFIKKLWEKLLKDNPGHFYSMGAGKLKPIKKVFNIFMNSLNNDNSYWSEITSKGLSINLEPFLESFFFTIIKEGKDDTVIVMNSKGEPLQANIVGKNGRYLIYYLNTPTEEKWFLKLIRNETAWFRINKIYPEIKIKLPEAIKKEKGLPVFICSKTFEFNCSVFRNDSIVKNQDLTLQIYGKEMNYNGNGKYIGKISPPLKLKRKSIDTEIKSFWKTQNIPLRGNKKLNFILENSRYKTNYPLKPDYKVAILVGIILSTCLIFLFLFYRKNFKKKDELIFIKKKELEKNNKEKDKITKELITERERFDALFQVSIEKKMREISYRITTDIRDILDKPTAINIERAITILKTALPEFKIIELNQFQKFPGISDLLELIFIANKKNTKDDNSFKNIEFIIDLLNNESYSQVLLKDVSIFLWDKRWKDGFFDRIISDIYKIIEKLREAGPLLSYIVETETNIIDKDIEIQIKRIVSFLLRIYYCKEEILKDNLINNITEMQKSYQYFYKSVLGKVGLSLFKSLMRLAESIKQSPYPNLINFPVISNLEHDLKIYSWEKVTNDCKKILEKINESNFDYYDLIKIFKSVMPCYEGINKNFPEMKILGILLNEWYCELKDVPKGPVKIECQFSPPLIIDNEMLSDLNCSKFSLTFKNKSTVAASAYNLCIKLKSKDGLVKKCDESIKKLSRNEVRLTNTFIIFKPIDKFEIIYSYNAIDFETKKWKLYSSKLDIVNISDNICKKKSHKEPYIVFYPYSKGTFYINRINAEDKIIKNLKITYADIFHILGMRRIGKTSLINYIEKYFSKKSNQVRIIKIPCGNYIEQNEKGIYTIWNPKKLLGNIAREIERKYDKEFFSNFNILPPEKGEMDKEHFKAFITEIMKKKNSKEILVIIFDDADYFEKSVLINKNKTPLFPDFKNLVEEYFRNLIDMVRNNFNGGFYIIFSGWKGVLGEMWSKIYTIGNEKNIFLSSFSKEQVRQVAHWGGIRYNNLSIEYLWRLSGGFPQIVQFLCKEVSKKIKELDMLGRKIEIVPLSLLHKVVEEIVSKEENWKIFYYIIKFGLPKSAYKDLYFILKTVDNKTLKFNTKNLKNKNFKILMETEFINFESKPSNQGKIQAGILKLLLDSRDKCSNRNFFKDSLEIDSLD